MEVALSIDLLKWKVSSKYDCDEKSIIGIMMARYDISLTKNIISDSYKYWNLNTGEFLDIFWAGYGQYLSPKDQTSTKTILDFSKNDDRVYFDLEAFISIKNKFNQLMDKKYEDHIELILANYYNGKIHFDEAFKVDLEKNGENNSAIRRIIELITNECKAEHDVVSLISELKKTEFFDIIKGVKISDAINIVLTALGIII